MKSIKEIMRASAVLNADGIHIGGSDRESNHQYGDAYESLFDGPHCTSREDVKLVMEIGVADGSCLLAWREIFPNATVVGMDVHPSDRARGERIEFYLGDQRLRADCERAAAGQQFDMIVEDATHTLVNTLLTLLWLWPSVRPGGLYVIEEFDDIGSVRSQVISLFPFALIVDTVSPFGGVESLVVLRKPV